MSSWRAYLLSLLAALFFIQVSNAQITSSTLQGKVKDVVGETLTGATVLAVHLPTGTQYGTITELDGQYVLPNLKAGGPYQVTTSYTGFEDRQEPSIYLPLGVVTKLNFELEGNITTLDIVEVKYDRNDPLKNKKQGTGTNIGQDRIESLPSLNRSLQDMTRLSPQGGANTFAGTNYRFNNISIDGASNNDVLGFQEPASGAGGSVASGTPGALAGTQPISLDAVQEVQVSIAPYDVRQGNFTGASLNVVTRSGTNKLEGSAYFFGHNQNTTGKSVTSDHSRLEDFYDFQTGVRLGGPILKNKLFVFGNYERTRRSEPVLGVPGTAESNVPLDVAVSITDFLKEKFDYDPGSFQETTNDRRSDKFFLRFDYNLGKNHQLVLRNNYVKASADNLERGSRILNFSSQGFTHHSTTNSAVVELKSRFGNHLANHLTIGHNITEDKRTWEGRPFPHIEINYNTSNKIFLGPYREASIYGLTLNTTQIRDHLSFYKNDHTLTIGTDNEFYHLEYRFLTAWNGRWAYRTLEDFFNERPERIRGVYNLENNDFEYNRNRPSADFRVFLMSLYLQDEYRPNDRLTITAGVRFDMQLQPDQVPLNPEVVETPEFSQFDNQFGGEPQVNPRLGFSYLLNEEKGIRLRGGTGWFTGRIPFAWYAYARYISGNEYGNVDIRPGGGTFPLEEDISQLQNLQPGLTEINLVDNDFKLPRVLRSSLALDYSLDDGTVLTFEALYSKTLQGIQFQSINLRDEVARYNGADQRYYYTASGSEKKINPNFTNVFLLKNTSKGYQYNLTVSVLKQWSENLSVTAAYTYGKSKDISNGVRNSMAANFNWNQAVQSNNPNLAWSNFDLRHRIIATTDFKHTWNEKHLSYISAVLNIQSGNPFSYTVGGDLNKDGSSANDLVFVPANQQDIVLKDIVDEAGNVIVAAADQWQQLDAFIENDQHLSGHRGRYAERNGGRTPWNYQLDLRAAHRFLFQHKQSVELTLDIFNLPNLLNNNWGRQYFVPNLTNSSFQLLEFEGIEEGKPTYQFKNKAATPWQVDTLLSRWRLQMGLRVNF